MVAWLTIVFRGYQPEGVNDTLTFVNGFYARVDGYFALLTDDYPPIGIEAAKPPRRRRPADTSPPPHDPAARASRVRIRRPMSETGSRVR